MIQRLGGLGEATPLAFWLALLACAYLAVVAARLTVIDIRHHLLPDRIVFPSYAVAGALLLGAAAVHTVSGTASAAVPDGGAGLFGVPGRARPARVRARIRRVPCGHIHSLRAGPALAAGNSSSIRG